jgi:hypothetical protein
MHTAVLYWERVGEAGTAPAESTVVVPLVTALIVQTPTPTVQNCNGGFRRETLRWHW